MMDILLYFNWLDWLLLAGIALSALFGLYRGLLWEALSLVIWGSAALGAAFLGAPLAGSNILAQQLDHQPTRLLLAYLAVFVILLALGVLIRTIVGHAAQRSFLRPADRLFGLVFGSLRGMLLVLFAAIFLPLQNYGYWEESQLIQLSRSYEKGFCQLLDSFAGIQCDTQEEDAALRHPAPQGAVALAPES